MQGSLARDGYGAFVDAETVDRSARLAEGVARLVEAKLPAVFAYAFSSLWELGERLRGRVSEALGRPYFLVNDVWAFQIDPGTHGWPPHRGLARVLDRKAPELINGWIALTDATIERSCIHVVPLDADPHYPDRLDSVDFNSLEARALPVRAGTALAWNANVLHWGGACLPTAEARISVSFSLCRDDVTNSFATVNTEAMDFAGRLDVIARQILTYGESQSDVSADARRWAQATSSLSERVRHLCDEAS